MAQHKKWTVRLVDIEARSVLLEGKDLGRSDALTLAEVWSDLVRTGDALGCRVEVRGQGSLTETEAERIEAAARYWEDRQAGLAEAFPGETHDTL